jgi:hypothetical protein
MILGLFKYTSVSFKGYEETRGSRVRVLEIFHIFCLVDR